LPPVELGALAGDVTQPRQHGTGCFEQPVLTGGGGELTKPWTEHEAALHVAGDEAVMLERCRESVGGGTGQSSC
jgi:hypothetical protein